MGALGHFIIGRAVASSHTARWPLAHQQWSQWIL